VKGSFKKQRGGGVPTKKKGKVNLEPFSEPNFHILYTTSTVSPLSAWPRATQRKGDNIGGPKTSNLLARGRGGGSSKEKGVVLWSLSEEGSLL
jgi:hypothetical protein